MVTNVVREEEWGDRVSTGLLVINVYGKKTLRSTFLFGRSSTSPTRNSLVRPLVVIFARARTPDETASVPSLRPSLIRRRRRRPVHGDLIGLPLRRRALFQ